MKNQASHIFSTKNIGIFQILMFEMFEQLGPDLQLHP